MKSLQYELTPEKENEIWKKAIFVFDTSAILNFYELTDTNRKDVYENIFSKLQGKLWITNQTEYEFLKNREKASKKPEELYKEIQDKFNFLTILQKLTGQLTDIKLKTGKETRHPYLNPTIFEDTDNSLNILGKSLNQLNKKINDEITKG